VPSEELATGTDVRAVPTDTLRAGQLLWATVDSPWVHQVDHNAYLRNVRAMQSIDADVTLSSHLPPAHGLTAQLSDMLAAAPDTDPFVGPDQQALEQMLATFEPAGAPS
jgi:hypothetical protein